MPEIPEDLGRGTRLDGSPHPVNHSAEDALACIPQLLDWTVESSIKPHTTCSPIQAKTAEGDSMRSKLFTASMSHTKESMIGPTSGASLSPCHIPCAMLITQLRALAPKAGLLPESQEISPPTMEITGPNIGIATSPDTSAFLMEPGRLANQPTTPEVVLFADNHIL